MAPSARLQPAPEFVVVAVVRCVGRRLARGVRIDHHIGWTPRCDQLLRCRRDDRVRDRDGDARRIRRRPAPRALRCGSKRRRAAAPVSTTISATSNSRLPEEWREGLAEECGSDVTPMTFSPAPCAERDVENHGVDAGMGKQDHRIGGIELMRAQDRLAIALDRMNETILARAHVAPDAMKRDHRAFDDRAKADDRPGARKHLQRRKRAVTGAEGEDQLVGGDRSRAGLGGAFDRLGLRRPDMLETLGQGLEIAIDDRRS